MSDSGTWRAEEALPGKPNGWCVEVVNLETGYDHVIMDLDEPTAHRIAAVNELEAALDRLVLVTGVLPKSFDDASSPLGQARAALAKARGDQ